MRARGAVQRVISRSLSAYVGKASEPADWVFPIPTTFGAGRASEVSSLLQARGAFRPLVVTDRGLGASDLIEAQVDALTSSGLSPLLFADVDANPTDVNIYAGADAFRSHDADSLVAIGGGSGLDAGKAIAMVARSGFLLDDFEWTKEPVVVPAGSIPPVITLPTTAGTGAEMDSASMYTDTTSKIKLCVAHTDCRVSAVVDPMLTLSLPANLTAWTGMDALTHAIEALSVDSFHPMCDGIALQSLLMIDKWLPVAYADGNNIEARAQMLTASSMAAVAFQKGLGATHGLSEPIGAVFDTQHGLTNAIVLPHVLRANRLAIDNKCDLLARYLNLAPAPAEYGATGGFGAVCYWVDSMSLKLNIPTSLAEIGVKDDTAASELALKAVANPTGFTNPIRFTANDYESIFKESFKGRDRSVF